MIVPSCDNPSGAYIADLLWGMVENPLEDDDVAFVPVALLEIVSDTIAEVSNMIISAG